MESRNTIFVNIAHQVDNEGNMLLTMRELGVDTVAINAGNREWTSTVNLKIYGMVIEYEVFETGMREWPEGVET
jgi:hypothetical protein